MRLVLPSLSLTLCVLFWVFRGDQTRDVAAHLFVYWIAFASYLAALDAARGLSRRALGLCLALAASWRILLALAPPLLSDDVYRYVWEGRVQLHGANPYETPPDSEPLRALRDGTWDLVNHKEYTAIYPPFFELFARGVVSVADSVGAMKLSLVGAEVCGLLCLGLVLRDRGLPPERILVQALSPFSLVEIAGSGHNDALGLLFVSMGLLGLSRGFPALSALSMGFGAATKLLPALFAAAWCRRYRAWHLALVVLPLVFCAVPFRGAGRGLFASLIAYSRLWRFNETLFALLAPLPRGVPAGILVVLAALLACSSALPEKKALVLAVAFLLLAPSVLPWYALWTLPLLVLVDAPEVLLFTLTVEFAYLVYPAFRSGEPWSVGWGVRSLEYGPVLALAAWRFRSRLGAAWTPSSSS